MTTFQIRFQSALDASGMTPAELSRKSGLSESTICHYRKGMYKPKNKKLYALAEALNVNAGWLMGYDVDTAFTSDTLNSLFEPLSADKQKMALDYLRYLNTLDNQ